MSEETSKDFNSDTSQNPSDADLKRDASRVDRESNVDHSLLAIGLFALASSAVVFLSAFISDYPFNSIIVIISGFVAYLSIGIVLFAFARFRQTALQIGNSYFRILSSAFAAILGVQNDRPKIDEYASVEKVLADIKRRLEVSSNGSSRLSDDAQSEIVSAYVAGINDQIGNNVRYLFNEAVSRQTSTAFISEAVDNLKTSEARLRAASTTVTARGFLNLVIGIVFAVAALYFLKDAIADFTSLRSQSPTEGAIVFLGIRLSLTILITAISYFFLSLYRTSLIDVRYYKIDITNISFRASAISIVARANKEEMIMSVVHGLMSDDRNRELTIADEKIDIGKILEKILDKIPEGKSI